jgi:hypothetical protein
MNILHKWGGKKFGNVMHQLTQLSRKLENLMACDTSREEIRENMDMMNELLYREEMLWLQRSRIMWLKEVIEIPSFSIIRQYGGLKRTR